MGETVAVELVVAAREVGMVVTAREAKMVVAAREAGTAVSMEAEREAETVEVGVVGRDLHEQH